MESWQSDDHEIEIKRETELESLPTDRAVWILGRENRFAAGLIAGNASVSISESDTGVKLAGENVSFAAHSTVVVFRHPENIEKAWRLKPNAKNKSRLYISVKRILPGSIA